MIALDQLTYAFFEPCIGQPFQAAGTTELTLTEVVIVGAARPGVEREPFALRFKGLPALRLPQRIYSLKNEQLGELDVFLVQTGADAAASHFEAVFS